MSSIVRDAVRLYFARISILEDMTDVALLRQLEADALAEIRAERGA